MPTKKRTRRVSLPRPRRTSSRAELVIVMHPTELDALIERARSRSMSLTRYVEALLSSDPDDVAPAPVRLSLAELAGKPDPRQPDPRQLTLEAAAPRTPEPFGL